MFDIIKDLKENIQKNNMKKLVISAVLGMFCYCTNNAMDDEEEDNEETKALNEVNNTIIKGHIAIYQAKFNIKEFDKKIYSAIKKEEKKVTKKNVLDFITNLYTQDEQNEKGFKDNINKIEQYFHLEEIIENNDECNEGNLTEIFWTAPETEEEIQGAITEEEKEPIKKYFNTIIKAENDLSTVFKSYYNTIKANYQDDEEILKRIMQICCYREETSDPVSDFIKNLKELWTQEEGEIKETILTTIKMRITLAKTTKEDDFIYFLKQKIGIKEKKEEEKINPKPKPEEEGGCSCCNDCCGKE